MTLTMVALGDGEIDTLLADPQLAFDLLFPEADEPAGDSSLIGLDKAWHGIHYLLTGTAWEGDPPLNALVVGGESLPDPDGEWGYGPPRLVRSGELAALSRALADISDEDLAARFDPADMSVKEIYPGIWGRDPEEDDSLGYLMEYVTVLREFLRAAVAHEQGALIALE